MWLIWRFEPNGDKKPRKVPYYACGGRRHGEQGTPEDLAALVTFDEARAQADRRQADGVGLATLPGFNICALDFDDCVRDGQVDPALEPVLRDTYAELSPSGRGVRVLLRGDLGNGKDFRGSEFGMEVFSSRGFVTFTGQVLPVVELLGNADIVAPVTPAVRELHARRFRRQQPDVEHVPNTDAVGLTEAQLQECLAALPGDLHYDDWLQVGMALHCETHGEGFELWESWSQASPKYSTREYNLERWASFGKHAGAIVTGRSLIRLAREHGATINLSGPAGADEFEALVESQQAKETPLRFAVQPAHEFAAAAPQRWRIKDVLPDAELAVMYGASGSGKSFIALDLAAAIARGVPWRGRRVRQGRVAYVAAEGAGGFRKRLQAYAQVQGCDLADMPLGVINAAPNMLEKADAVAVAAAIQAWGGADLVIVDTFAQVMPGGNENAGEDVGKALTHCKRIHEATGAMILLIHHAGKDASKGARGWSGLRAAADAELEVVREVAGRALRLTKSKDGQDGLEWGFELEVVQIGVDEDLDPITSCVVIEHQMPVGGVPTRRLGPVERAVVDVVQEIAASQTAGIELRYVIDGAVKLLEPPADGKRDTRRQRVKRALEALCNGDDAPYYLDADDSTLSIM